MAASGIVSTIDKGIRMLSKRNAISMYMNTIESPIAIRLADISSSLKVTLISLKETPSGRSMLRRAFSMALRACFSSPLFSFMLMW